MRKANSADLLFVSKAHKERIDTLGAGASLVTRTGYSVPALRAKATLDRVTLARDMLRSAELASAAKPSSNRTAVSRAYYSMYHALRAVTYFAFGGDDHEQHTVLPSRLPADFPNRAAWENSLKSARFERNRADYDPYPRRDDAFEQVAEQLILEATTLLPLVRTYLKRKGCLA